MLSAAFSIGEIKIIILLFGYLTCKTVSQLTYTVLVETLLNHSDVQRF